MRKTIVVPSFSLLSLALLVGLSSVGCKSMPKAPWSKTAANIDPSAATLARSAPAKPSDVARQPELAASQIAGGDAAPFVPGVSPAAMAATSVPSTAYPSTDAPNFSQAPSVATTASSPSTNLGSVKLPYDPNAVPPATLSPAEAALAAAEATAKSRYANVPTPTGTLPQLSNSTPAAAVSEAPKAGSRYGGYLASAQPPQTLPQSHSLSSSAVTPAGEMPAQVAAAAQSLAGETSGGRYAQAVAAATETVPTAVPSYVPKTTPTAIIPAVITPTPTAVASASPYRPGGTSSYPSTTSSLPGIAIATRPDSPVSSDAQVPNLGTPASSEPTAYPVTPQTPRYR